MHFKTIVPGKLLSLLVKSILVFEETEKDRHTVLPFFADGFPGLMFHETNAGLFVQPHNKKMPSLFLYGQTIHPIELDIHGPFRLIGFQLYPFVLKSFFNITAKDINDYCYDLTLLEGNGLLLKDLFKEKNTEQRIELLADYLLDIFRLKKDNLDFVIKQAIQLILENNGHSNVSDICGQLPLTQRTFERRFLKEVGVSPKQFSTIIQFQQSLEQLTMKEFSKLTDIVYSNGFSDQSHFIRVFKAFTGKTPKRFLNKAK